MLPPPPNLPRAIFVLRPSRRTELYVTVALALIECGWVVGVEQHTALWVLSSCVTDIVPVRDVALKAVGTLLHGAARLADGRGARDLTKGGNACGGACVSGA
jgi:hypothetical protein